jgi:outer membrane protein assembly factor BamB
MIAGKNYLTKNDIKAKQYIFPERIDNYYIDTTSNLLTVQLRGTSKNGKWLNSTGNVILYDLSNKKEKWIKKINYQQSIIDQFDNVMIQTIANKSYCLNIENGENLWEVENTIYYIDHLQKIGIGYKNKNSTDFSNTLEGIDLANGNPRWKREINREYGWNDIFHLNDSVIVVASSGLHSVNLKDGTGWDYDAITGEKDYKETIAANAIGAAVGVLTGTFVMSAGVNLVKDIVSNVLVDSLSIYFASKEKITRLDHDGQIKWSFPLAKGLASASSIFIKDSILYMINSGYAFMGNRQLDFGTPFIASFNKNTGKQIYFSQVNDKKDQIFGYKIYKDCFLLALKDRVAKYSMINGSNILEKSFDTSTLGELKYFIGSKVYFKSDSTYNSVDSTKNFLCTKTGKILVLNENLDILNQFESNQLYLCYLKTKNYAFLAKDNETTVIDHEYKKVADFKASNKTVLVGSKLYDVQEKSVLEIDIPDLIEN